MTLVEQDPGVEYNIASFLPSSFALMLRDQGAWTQGTLRIRVRGLGSQCEGEKRARISYPTPCKCPQPSLITPRKFILYPAG